MSDYALRIVLELAKALGAAIHADERPRVVERSSRVQAADERMVRTPGDVSVFINPAHRMILLHGDEYRPDLCRKINESRYGPAYCNAPVMGSANSEDATTWSFFRSLEKRCRPEWILRLIEAATGIRLGGTVDGLRIKYWFGRVTDEKLPVPPGVNETASEFDVLIEFYLGGQLHIVAVEAKVSSPFSGRERDQFVRVIDVGSYYAATKRVDSSRFWAVAVLPENWIGPADRNPHTTVAKYKRNAAAFRGTLAHRLTLAEQCGRLNDEDLGNLSDRVGKVTWEKLIEIVGLTHDSARCKEVGPWP